jgi:large subunit ribosomal protein L14e
VEAGRVCFVNYGPDYGKLCVIVDIIDRKKVFVDGTDFPRVVYPLRRLTLTKFKVPILRGARTSTLTKAVAKMELQKKWEASSAYKKLATAKTRSNLNDFERFSVMVHRKRRAYAVRKIVSVVTKGVKVVKKAAAKVAKKK